MFCFAFSSTGYEWICSPEFQSKLRLRKIFALNWWITIKIGSVVSSNSVLFIDPWVQLKEIHNFVFIGNRHWQSVNKSSCLFFFQHNVGKTLIAEFNARFFIEVVGDALK
jgi:hypothetical protein